MILITGGTGFIGRALVRQLVEANYPVRLLIRPSNQSPNLPRGIPVEAAICSLNDSRGLRSAMVDVETVYHLIGGEWRGVRANLLQTDIQSAQAVTRAAGEANVKRLFMVSHLGADRASAYPVLKAKGIAEEYVRRSGIDYTILRSGIVYGKGDSFTSGLARLLHAFPLVFLLPGEGSMLLQPLWVEDLATSLVWALDNNAARNQVFEVGGPEFLPFQQIVQLVMETLNIQRRLVSIPPAYLRILTIFLEQSFPGLPVSIYWLDYLASNRICKLDALPQIFDLMPGRFSQHLAHLKGENWRRSLFQNLMRKTN